MHWLHTIFLRILAILNKVIKDAGLLEDGEAIRITFCVGAGPHVSYSEVKKRMRSDYRPATKEEILSVIKQLDREASAEHTQTILKECMEAEEGRINAHNIGIQAEKINHELSRRGIPYRLKNQKRAGDGESFQYYRVYKANLSIPEHALVPERE